MRFFSVESFRLGLESLRLHKLRSLLTSLGIIFGVAAVISMLSISEGASADEMRMIQLLGTKNIIVNSVKPTQNIQVSEGNTALVEYGITRDDVSIIETTLPHIQHVVPLKTVSFRVRHGEKQAAFQTVGTTDQFLLPTIDERGRVQYTASGGRSDMACYRLDEATLREVAELTDGRYFYAKDTESLRSIYEEIDELEKTKTQERRFMQYTDLATATTVLGAVTLPPLLLGVLGLLVLEILLKNTVLRGLP